MHTACVGSTTAPGNARKQRRPRHEAVRAMGLLRAVRSGRAESRSRPVRGVLHVPAQVWPCPPAPSHPPQAVSVSSVRGGGGVPSARSVPSVLPEMVADGRRPGAPVCRLWGTGASVAAGLVFAVLPAMAAGAGGGGLMATHNFAALRRQYHALQPCRVCRLVMPRVVDRTRRCAACYAYWKRHGVERPNLDAPRHCVVCDRVMPAGTSRRGHCEPCYARWRRRRPQPEEQAG
jgi:hypothetical protein